jgi:glycosyltransferase involved in cell wall biosynthesis
MPQSTPPPAIAAARTHVLQVVGNAIVGGMESYVTRLVERLPRDRFAVSVLAPFESVFTDRLRRCDADVVITPIDDEPSWHSIQLACALIQSHAIDVVQSHLPNAHVLAGLAGRLTGRPVVATIHGRAMAGLDIEVQRLAGSHLAVVCRQSYFQALGVGVEAGHVHLVPTGVDTLRFRPEARRDGPLRRRFAIAASAPLVGFVGRLSPEKGPDVFLSAALAVRAACPHASFVLIGDGPMLKQLQTFAVRFGLGDVVHFAGAQDDMPAIFNELDVAVSSSHSEAMPLAVMEAMASGLPIVACKVGGITDLVEQGVSGWLADDGDYEALAARVVELLDDAALRAEAGRAARARVVSRFAFEQTLEATTRLYAQLTAQRSEPRRIGALHEAARPIRANGAARPVAAGR